VPFFKTPYELLHQGIDAVPPGVIIPVAGGPKPDDHHRRGNRPARPVGAGGAGAKPLRQPEGKVGRKPVSAAQASSTAWAQLPRPEDRNAAAAGALPDGFFPGTGFLNHFQEIAVQPRVAA